MTFPRQTTFWKFVAGLLAVELVSWLAYTGPRSELIITSGIVVLLVAIAWKRPTWLVFASIAELVVGGKGYLLFLTFGEIDISLRMILFVIVLLRAASVVLRDWKILRRTVVSNSFLIFVGWLLIAGGIALVRQNSLSSIYSDANAFMYLLLLPAWTILVRPDPNWKQRVVAIILAGATIIGLKSWLVVLLFGQDLHSISQMYHWIRNTGVGEITYINANVYRVFFQSHIYSLLVLCATLVVFIRQRGPRWLIIPMAMSAVGVYISLSRSFWLGFGVALLAICIWLIKIRAWKSISRLYILFPLVIFSWAMMVWALSFPGFSLNAGRANTVVSRLQGTDSANAATSRANQIRPLLKSIGHHPIIGSGFGTTVTYISTDPRAPGLRTTSAFELGYLDLWLKLGAVGVAVYAFWVIGLWRRVSRTPWAGFFLLSGIALVTVHMTTPYLNHPLGLGWLMLTSLFSYDRE